jgi:tetratricopeptide (TPR) repeat protein
MQKVRWAKWRLEAFCVAAASLVVACGGGAPAATAGARHAERAITPTPVTDAAFAGAVHDLLQSPRGSQDRLSRLAGVEGRQMEHAVARFHAHAAERGLEAVAGGLYLIKTGELDPETLGPSGHDALHDAARELALRGDEGRARALYEMLLRVTPPANQADVKGHLDALRAWNRDQATSLPPVVAAGMLESSAVARRVFEPSQVALDEAVSATTEWIGRGIALRNAVHERTVSPSREEVGEAVRAIQTGATVLCALYLRDADATGALHALDRAQVRDLARQELVRALESAADKPDANRWLDVLHALAPTQDANRDDEQFLDDHELLRAATIGIAMEAYRLDPTVPEAALVLAASLQELGLAEVSPALLPEATRAHQDPRTLGGALALTMRSMNLALEAEDADAARRAYAASLPLLVIADKASLGSKLVPSAARVRAMMGEIELRDGKLEAAQALLSQAASTEKSGDVLLQLARIAWHDGKVPAAKELLRDALSAQDTARDPALRGEILLMISDLTREQGDTSGAREPLASALKELAGARNTPDRDDRARVERVLSRVLDRFGAPQRAQQALERAYEATPHDKKQIAATLGQLVARAFVRGDLIAARDGLSRALAAELDSDDLVYYALWVRLLERQMSKPTDGTPGRVFASIVDDGGWAGRLAAFGAGKIKPDDLIASAKTQTQRTEALFYTAIDRRVSGDARGADDALKQVIAGSGLDLMEVGIARDLLSGNRAQVGGPLPSDVALP